MQYNSALAFAKTKLLSRVTHTVIIPIFISITFILDSSTAAELVKKWKALTCYVWTGAELRQLWFSLRLRNTPGWTRITEVAAPLVTSQRGTFQKQHTLWEAEWATELKGGRLLCELNSSSFGALINWSSYISFKLTTPLNDLLLHRGLLQDN